MSAQNTYTQYRGGRKDLDIPRWSELPVSMQEAFEAVYAGGIHAAAEYVDGNWSDASSMAEHLRRVGNGEAPMYEV